jgi:vacuolar-type H+-ATPase subunit F/Vma7
MSEPQDVLPATRMLFLGDDSLADGFRLIGFETHSNPTPEQVDLLFRDLRRSGDKAFVIVDDVVMASEAGNLKRVRDEGGRIVVVSVPGLAGPPQLASEVAERLAAMFGSSNQMQQP